MCILVVKPAGIDFPSIETMRNCFLANPDGAGIAYNEEEKVKIYKGIMKFEHFEKIYKKISIYKDKAFLIHFRIGTHGLKRSPKHTHPFPLTQNYRDMEKTKFICHKAMAHNGIIGSINFGSQYSDTMEFNAGILSPLLAKYDSLTDINFTLQEILQDSNRLATIDSDGNIEIYGKFYRDNGILYSNQSYLDKIYTVPKKSSYSRCEFSRECLNYNKLCQHCADYSFYDDTQEFPSCPNQEYCLNYPKKCISCDGWNYYHDRFYSDY